MSRAKRLYVYLTSDEKEELFKLCENLKVPASSFVRALILAFLQNRDKIEINIKPHQVVINFNNCTFNLNLDSAELKRLLEKLNRIQLLLSHFKETVFTIRDSIAKSDSQRYYALLTACVLFIQQLEQVLQA